MFRRIVIGLIIVAALGVGGWLVYRNRAASRASAASSVQTSTVERGALVSSVSAAGAIASPQSTTLAWRTTGTVGAVHVKAGDVVAAGAVLMELDPASLDPSMLKAQSDLLAARQTLEARLAPSAAEQQLAKARMAVLQAEQAISATERSLRYALNPVSQNLYDAVRDAKVALDVAKNNAQLASVSQDVQDYNGAVYIVNWFRRRAEEAQAKLEANSGSLELQDAAQKAWADYQAQVDKQAQRQLRIETDQAAKQNAVAQTQTAYDKAAANLNSALQGPDLDKVKQLQAQLELDKANLAAAQDELARLQASPDPTNIAAARAQVAAAQATVNQTRLTAPFTGTVVALSSQLGDAVLSAGQSAVTLADLSAMEVNIDVSEVDIGRVAAGQEAALTLDAVPGQTFTGTVAVVGEVGRSQQGVVTFPVKVVIANPDPALKAGMTAAISIVVERHENVLLVPNRAIRAVGGQRTVTVLFEGQQYQISVTLGLSNETMTEVVTSSPELREGDAVVINTTTATTNRAGVGGFGLGGILGGGGVRVP